mmetsp:Transcript_18271/g.45282  ORF Transcript_18271/g.45282 Transcript_18271/m.45282 type:complete len:123 (-) Transcript_18271:114-482(-)
MKVLLSESASSCCLLVINSQISDTQGEMNSFLSVEILEPNPETHSLSHEKKLPNVVHLVGSVRDVDRLIERAHIRLETGWVLIAASFARTSSSIAVLVQIVSRRFTHHISARKACSGKFNSN